MSLEGIIGVVTALVTLCSTVITSPCWAPLLSRDTTRTTELLKGKIQTLRLLIEDIKQKKRGETGVFTKQASGLIAESDALLAQLDDSIIVELEGKIDKKCLCGILPHLCIQKKAQSEMEGKLIPSLKVLTQKAESFVSQPNLCRGYKQSREVDIEGRTRKETKEKIWKLVSSAEKPNVICIHGILGVGKTAMAKSIHNRALGDEYEELFRHVVWVDVEYGADVRRVQDCIAKSLNIEYAAEEERGKRLENALSEMDSFLLVLDSMWKPMSLKDIGVPELVGRRRKVIVTSRISSVCDQMGEMTEMFEMQPLPCEEEAWELFQKGMAGRRLFLEETLVKKALMSELDGLPLAINKFALAPGNNTKEDEQISIAHIYQELFNHFTRSYLFLDEKMRPCFMYCALFPKGHLINAKELMEYWMWEGLLGDDFSTLEDGRTEGKTMLRGLQSAHLLQRVGSGDDERVKMLSLFRAMAIETMAKEGKTVCIRSGGHLTSLPPSGRDWNSKVVRASFIKNKLKVLDLKDNKKCGQLSTLLLQDNFLNSDRNNDDFFGSMHNLRVLDLSRTKITNLPKSLSNLKKLCALVLRCCSNLTKLPNLSKLQQLIVLDLCGTPLEHWPLGIEKMKKLRRLDLSKTRLESFPAKVVGHHLLDLEELLMITNCNCVWGSTEDEHGTKGACIEDLFKLQKLAVLQIHLGNPRALFKFVRYVEDYTKLPQRFRFLVGDIHSRGGGYYVEENSLSVSGVDMYKTTLKSELDVVILHKLFRDLNVLEVSNMSGLKYLFSVDILGSLTNLRELHVTRCDDMEELIQKPSQDATIVCLPRLTRMVLFDLPRLTDVCCGQVLNCPDLRYIEVWRCQNLKLPMIMSDQTYQGSNPRLKIRIKGERSWWLNNLEWDNLGKSNPDFRGSPHSHSNFTFIEEHEPPKLTPRPNARSDPREEEEANAVLPEKDTGFRSWIGTPGFKIAWVQRNLNGANSFKSNGTNYSQFEIGEQRSRLDNPENSNPLIQDTTPHLNSNLRLVEAPVPPKLEATTRDEP